MKPDWLKLLAARGANVERGVARDFGDPHGERTATATASILADLSPFGLLAVAGDDARTFLHGQLSCDVDGLADDASVYGAYCTAKGRVLANFLLWRATDRFLMLLPRALIGGLHQRLKMFVLRSEVTLAEAGDEPVLLGVSGPAATAAVAGLIGVTPVVPLGVARGGGSTAIALSGGRYLVAVPVARAAEAWDRLAATVRPVGTPCWEWLEIASGLPWITAATQGQFVPQMANLELIGGVNFRKGCYPGQEIVARTQYRGELKRRLFLGHVDADASPVPGEALVSGASGEQSAGMVVNAAPAPDGGFDVLAVVQTASAGGGTVRLGSGVGPALRFRPLPYAVT